MAIPCESRFTLSILVVDDDEVTANSLATLLAMKGYASRPALSAQEALLATAADTPDVVMLDLMMPGMDGWELAQRLRDQATVKQPLLVAVTDCYTDADRWRSADSGIDLVLVKPVDPAILMGFLNRFTRALAPGRSAFSPRARFTRSEIE
jgi:DNA-binding response OmpR family regulator